MQEEQGGDNTFGIWNKVAGINVAATTIRPLMATRISHIRVSIRRSIPRTHFWSWNHQKKWYFRTNVTLFFLTDDVINSDIGSNSDSYGHGGPLTSIEPEHHSIGPHLPGGPGNGIFLATGATGHFNGLHQPPGSGTPPYLSGSHSPIPSQGASITPNFAYGEGLIYPHPTGMSPSQQNGQLPAGIPRLVGPSGPGSDVSNNSSNQGYPEFPPSPASWLDDVDNSAHAQQYWSLALPTTYLFPIVFLSLSLFSPFSLAVSQRSTGWLVWSPLINHRSFKFCLSTSG